MKIIIPLIKLQYDTGETTAERLPSVYTDTEANSIISQIKYFFFSAEWSAAFVRIQTGRLYTGTSLIGNTY